MLPTRSASLTLADEASSAGNAFEVPPGIDDDDARDRSAFSQFDPLMADARVEELGSADRLKDEFLATVCHELRSPIGAIQNAVNVLRSRGRTKRCSIICMKSSSGRPNKWRSWSPDCSISRALRDGTTSESGSRHGSIRRFIRSLSKEGMKWAQF